MHSPDNCLDDEIEGAVNLRDLGGLAAGSRRVRCGLVFRSAMTHGISGTGLARLAERYGVRTIFDLRSHPERERDGVLRPEASPIRLEHVPVYGETAVTADAEEHRYRAMARGEYDWCARYQVLATDHADSFVRLVRALVGVDTLPAIFHCTAGRDRTGIAAALLLGALGASEADIETDYVRTGTHLARHLPRFERVRERMAFSDEELLALLRPDPAHMRRFLGWLETEHGGAEGFLRRRGMSAGELGALRDRLLE